MTRICHESFIFLTSLAYFLTSWNTGDVDDVSTAFPRCRALWKRKK